MYPDKTRTPKYTRTPMFTAALFTIAKKWKQPKCPSTDEWRKKTCISTMEYHSAIKKNRMMPFAATSMQLEIIILCEVRRRKTKTMWYHLCVGFTTQHKWTYLWNRNGGCQGGRGWEGMDWKFGVSRCKLSYIEWINNKVLLYGTGNYIQYHEISDNGKEYEKGCVYI